MDDLISRQAALDAMETWDKFGCDPDGKLVRYDDDKHYIPYVHYEDMVHAIKHLPSAQPERKSKKCVWCDSPYRIEYYWIDEEGCTASFQDEERHIVATGIANFCPNCGADIRGEQDGRFNQQTGGD